MILKKFKLIKNKHIFFSEIFERVKNNLHCTVFPEFLPKIVIPHEQPACVKPIRKCIACILTNILCESTMQRRLAECLQAYLLETMDKIRKYISCNF